MRVFVTAIDKGSFAAAAREVGLTPSAVSKLVTRLESRLGVKLLNRTTRRLSLTAEGETYASRGRMLLQSVDDLETEVTATLGRPKGTIRINCGLAFGLHQLCPALPEFCARYPDIRIDLSLDDHIIDLYAEQADVAIRTGPLRDSSLLARKITEFSRIVCASPAYLETHGIPRTPADLANHNCLVLTAAPGLGAWPFRTASGEIQRVRIDPAITSDAAEAVLRLAISGAGIMRFAEFLVAKPIRAGQLVPLLEDVNHADESPIWALFVPGTQRQPRLRVFLDFLYEKFSHAPWRQAAK